MADKLRTTLASPAVQTFVERVLNRSGTSLQKVLNRVEEMTPEELHFVAEQLRDTTRTVRLHHRLRQLGNEEQHRQNFLLELAKVPYHLGMAVAFVWAFEMIKRLIKSVLGKYSYDVTKKIKKKVIEKRLHKHIEKMFKALEKMRQMGIAYKQPNDVVVFDKNLRDFQKLIDEAQARETEVEMETEEKKDDKRRAEFALTQPMRRGKSRMSPSAAMVLSTIVTALSPVSRRSSQSSVGSLRSPMSPMSPTSRKSTRASQASIRSPTSRNSVRETKMEFGRKRKSVGVRRKSVGVRRKSVDMRRKRV